MTDAAITYLNPKPHVVPRAISHGGDIAAAVARFGAPADGRPEDYWLDLSTGINPNPYPLAPIPENLLSRLPGTDEMERLLNAARNYYGVAEMAEIVAAPGSQALVQLVPELFKPASVSILGPTYGEHEQCWIKAGHSVIPAHSTCTQAAGVTNYAVVVNPNNPTGTKHQVDGLLALADEMHERGGALLVDEAFADVEAELSLCPHAGTPGLVILRSFGKFFGLGGVRLGFAITDNNTATVIKDALGPWAVSGPAIWAGISAFSDNKWIEETKTQLADNAKKLDLILQSSSIGAGGEGMEIIGGTSLFRLAQSDLANEIFERLGRAGILIRPFDENPKWLRFGIPANKADFARLENALAI